MKRFIKIIPLILIFSLSLTFTSCVNSVGNSSYTEPETVIFHGNFTIEETFVNQNIATLTDSRSAQPTLPTSGLTYYAKAYNKNTPSDFIESKDLNQTSKTFSIPLKTGATWIIEVGATGPSTFGGTEILIKDSFEFTPSVTTPRVQEHTFNLVPYITDNGHGKLNLIIGIENPENNKISVLEIKPIENKWKVSEKNTGWSDLSNWDNDSQTLVLNVPQGTSRQNISINSDNFKSGIWEVLINFKDDDDQLLFASTQIICVYDNLKTEKWENSKTTITSNELITSTGDFYLTTQLIDSFGLTDFYVGGTGASDDGNGSPKNPFETISKAISVVNAIGRADKTYTIHILNGKTEVFDDTIVILSNISIECYDENYGDRKGTTTIYSKSSGPVIQVGSDDPNLTISPLLTIDGIKLSDDSWSGLNITKHNNRTSSANSIGIRVHQNASLYINGGRIYNNIINNINGNGAGVLVKGNGFFSMSGGIINNNSTTGNGGGVYIEPDGTFQMSGGKITNNNASNFGAGVYNAGTLTLSGKSYIYNNVKNTSIKSNVYLPENKYIKISGNIAGSTIGITPINYPVIGGEPVQITDGYLYKRSMNAEIPSKIFKSDKDGYSVLVDTTNLENEDADYTGDVYLGIGGGLFYTASDYNFALSMASSDSTVTKGTEKTITVTPAITRKEKSGTTTLYYNASDKKLYKDNELTELDPFAEDDLVSWEVKLLHECIQLPSAYQPQVVTPSETDHVVKYTIPALPYTGKYTLQVTVSFMGLSYISNFSITCE